MIRSAIQFGILAAALLAAQARGDDERHWSEWPLGDRFVLGAGAFMASLDTKVRIDSSNGITGTQLDFEQNLGLTDTKGLPIAFAQWRFAKRHQLNLSYFDLSRTGTEITQAEIRIGDSVFQADLPVSSLFDITTTALAYQYSLIFDEKKELALGVGLALEDIRLGLSGNTGAAFVEEQAKTSTPVPTFNITGGYAFTEKFTIRAGVGYLAVDLDLGRDDELSGKVFEAGFALYHQTFPNVRIGLGYSVFDLDVNWTDKGKLTDIEYNYHGPQLTVGVTF